MSSKAKVVDLFRSFPSAGFGECEDFDINGFADRFREVLDVLSVNEGMTERDCAKKTGVTERVIQVWKDKPPQQLESFLKIVVGLDIDPLWLLSGVSIDQLSSEENLTEYSDSDIALAAQVLRAALGEVSLRRRKSS
jgi:transcriptional regulator with XRE-family HTH domain